MTNYDTLKEYEAHKEPLPTYTQYIGLLDDSKELDKAYDKIKRLQEQINEANEMLKGAKHLTVKDSNGAIMFELVSPEINDYLEKWGVK